MPDLIMAAHAEIYGARRPYPRRHQRRQSVTSRDGAIAVRGPPEPQRPIHRFNVAIREGDWYEGKISVFTLVNAVQTTVHRARRRTNAGERFPAGSVDDSPRRGRKPLRQATAELRQHFSDADPRRSAALRSSPIDDNGGWVRSAAMGLRRVSGEVKDQYGARRSRGPSNRPHGVRGRFWRGPPGDPAPTGSVVIVPANSTEKKKIWPPAPHVSPTARASDRYKEATASGPQWSAQGRGSHARRGDRWQWAGRG